MNKEKKVLFVCLGNICRSPLAEGIFNHLVREKGLSQSFSSESCGTAGYHAGELPDYRTRQVAEEHGIVLQKNARKFNKNDFEKYDLIVSMDTQNLFDLERIGGNKYKNKLKLLMEYSQEYPKIRNVYDPYYDGIEKFREVYVVIESCIKQLLLTLESETK